MHNYFATCDANGPVSVLLSSAHQDDAIAEFDSIISNEQEHIENGTHDIECEHDIAGFADMTESEVTAALRTLGFVLVCRRKHWTLWHEQTDGRETETPSTDSTPTSSDGSSTAFLALPEALRRAISILTGYAQADHDAWTNEDGEFDDPENAEMDRQAWEDIALLDRSLKAYDTSVDDLAEMITTPGRHDFKIAGDGRLVHEGSKPDKSAS